MRRYLHILSSPGALLPFLASFAARLPVSMAPLGIVLLVQSVRGAYAPAGLVTAAFTLGVAVANPIWGALIDRVGQPRVIIPLSAASAVLLALLAVGAVRGASDAVLIGFAAGVGATFPPISPAMRAAWRVVVEDEDDRRAAYALEGVVIEVVFVGGPLLLSLLLVTTSPVVPLLVTAGLMGVGGIGYAATRAARTWRPEPHHEGPGTRGPSPLRVPGVAAVLTVALLVAIAFGQLDVSLAATAQKVLGDQALVGLLFMCIAGGSVVGGTWYGTRRWLRGEYARLPFSLTGLCLGMSGVTALITLGVSALGALMPLLFLTGLSIAPGLIMMANLIDDHASRDRLSEAQSRLTTAFTAGGAAGTALAGVLIDHGGPSRSFLGATLGMVGAALLALAAQRFWRLHTP
jgi:predicted MFS family arabinose efflux permease